MNKQIAATTTRPPAERGQGRPTKFSEEVAQIIIDAVSDGCPITHASTISGVTFQTVCNWRELNPDFAERVKQATSFGIRSRLSIVKRAMESKDENVQLRAAIWWLCHAPGAKEHFSERMTIATPDGSPPIQIFVAVDGSRI